MCTVLDLGFGSRTWTIVLSVEMQFLTGIRIRPSDMSFGGGWHPQADTTLVDPFFFWLLGLSEESHSWLMSEVGMNNHSYQLVSWASAPLTKQLWGNGYSFGFLSTTCERKLVTLNIQHFLFHELSCPWRERCVHVLFFNMQKRRCNFSQLFFFF